MSPSALRRAVLLAAAALVLPLALAACGSSGNGRDDLLVSGATSLKRAFTEYGERFSVANVQLSFAGSDELAAQIRSGAKPDVFAAANTKLPEQLFAEGLVEKPRVFAANKLVLAVLDNDTRTRAIEDLAEPNMTIAVGAPGVPIGAYTRKVLGRLPASTRRRILANVRSNEPDVGGITAKISEGAVRAGLLYATDVAASNGRLRAIELPPELQPDVAYGVAIVKGSKRRGAARDFVVGLLRGDGADALRAARFEPPPGS